jgi:putative membrane protein
MTHSTTASRFATPLLWIHGALILFSTAALVTILAGTPPAWLTQEPAQTIYLYGWHLSGPSYVIIGALAALCHAAGKLGWPRALTLLLVGFAISLSAELTGTSTGLPFGPYVYTPLLGYRILGLVPFPIPLSWFYMLYCSLAMCGRLLEPGITQRTKWRWAIVAGLILTAWDVSMDPAMTRATTHWIWHTHGFFYGMPLLNWFGWWLTGTLVSRAMLAIVPPNQFATQVSPSRLPLILYALNGIMPIALCLRHSLWWAGILGAIAMALPLSLSSCGIIFRRWRSRSPQRAQPA